MTAGEILTEGRRLRVRRLDTDDEWCEGHVVLASSNGKSVAVELRGGMVRTRDGGLIGCVLPLSVDYEQQTVTGLEGTEYEVELGRV